MNPRLDIINYIANADYLVQLSDNEGYCYSVVESLAVGTPVIVTECPVFKEIGCNNKNSFILDFNLNKVPVDEIYKGLPKFEYTPKKDTWDKYLEKGKSTYKEDFKTIVKVKCITPYTDTQFKKDIVKGSIYEVTKARADELVENDVAEII